MRMDLETSEELFKLVDGRVLLVRAWRTALKTVVSFRDVSFAKLN